MISANMQLPSALNDAELMYSYNIDANANYAELQKKTPWLRDKINAIETKMKGMEQVELKTEHFFSPGIYTRVLHIPKGCLLTGKIHNEPILNIMIKGDISVLIGDEVKRIIAPYYIVSPAGSKKIGYAHEDTIWIGCHGTDEVDVTKIEKRFVSASEQEFLEYCGQLQLPNLIT